MPAFLILLGLLLPPQTGRLLNSFETFDEIRQVKVLNAQVATSTDYASEGKHSLRVTFAPAEWPHVQLTPEIPWDLSQCGAISIDITNPSQESINFGIRIDDDASGNGWLHSRTATGAVDPATAQTVTVVIGPDPASIGMRGLPPYPDRKSLTAVGGGTFDLHHVVNLQVFLHKPAKTTILHLDNICSLPPISLKHIVDTFGQYTGADWPGKIHKAADFAAQRKEEAADLMAHLGPADRDRFGGWLTGPKLSGTGFFRTEKQNGKWWLVDPDGRLFFSYGMDAMGLEPEATFMTGRDEMFSWRPFKDDPLHQFLRHDENVHMGPVKSGDTFNFCSSNLYRKLGPDFQVDWRAASLERLTSWGFNTIGNWSDEGFIKNGHVPYVATAGVAGSFARVSSGSDYWGQMPDPFDPAFARAAVHSLTGVALKVQDDPWCLGYFVDNELSWVGDGPEARYGLGIGALAAPKGSPAKEALVHQLQKKYVDIASLNTAWKTHFKDWDAMFEPTKLDGSLNAGQRADLSAFVHEFARQYFRVVRSALKELDTKHLYLGCRFAWHGPEAEEAAAEFCDVISYNIYAPKLDSAEWEHVNKLGKPCIIGEFHFGSLDRGMFHPGLVSTPNQAARAAMYDDYVRSVLKHPAFVGCHWFQYIDEPLTGRSFDGENYNIGFVSITDTPYTEMVGAARKVHAEGYRVRSGG